MSHAVPYAKLEHRARKEEDAYDEDGESCACPSDRTCRLACYATFIVMAVTVSACIVYISATLPARITASADTVRTLSENAQMRLNDYGSRADLLMQHVTPANVAKAFDVVGTLMKDVEWSAIAPLVADGLVSLQRYSGVEFNITEYVQSVHDVGDAFVSWSKYVKRNGISIQLGAPAGVPAQ
jgi:hypothetical protein